MLPIFNMSAEGGSRVASGDNAWTRWRWAGTWTLPSYEAESSKLRLKLSQSWQTGPATPPRNSPEWLSTLGIRSR